MPKKNEAVHHCRRDLNHAATSVKANKLRGERFRELRRAISESEREFAILSIKYPPLPSFTLPEDYFNHYWGDTTEDAPKPKQIEKGIRLVRERVEKALRRIESMLSVDDAFKAKSTLYTILYLIERL